MHTKYYIFIESYCTLLRLALKACITNTMCIIIHCILMLAFFKCISFLTFLRVWNSFRKCIKYQEINCMGNFFLLTISGTKY